jgi:hypothetical protein
MYGQQISSQSFLQISSFSPLGYVSPLHTDADDK